jgi:hypothetical protein
MYDNREHRVIGLKLIKRTVDFVDHGGIDCVEFIGSVQAEQGDWSLLAKCDGFECHATAR